MCDKYLMRRSGDAAVGAIEIFTKRRLKPRSIDVVHLHSNDDNATLLAGIDICYAVYRAPAAGS